MGKGGLSETHPEVCGEHEVRQGKAKPKLKKSSFDRGGKKGILGGGPRLQEVETLRGKD